MKAIFEEENRLQKMLDVEAALAWAHAEVGNVPRKDAQKIMEMATTKSVKLDRVKEIESQIRHDVTSVVRALAEVAGSSGGYVHLEQPVKTLMTLRRRCSSKMPWKCWKKG